MTTSPIKSLIPLGFPWKTQDPFLFCVHHEDDYPKGNAVLGPAASLSGRNIGQDFGPNPDNWRMYHGEKVPGFPAHPHRGFETVTIVTRGIVDHSDSLGAAGRFGNGDVQWMTAGKGVQHSEMFPLLKTEEENPLELFQIWLNLPQKHKMVPPHFSMLWGDTIPLVTQTDMNGKNTQVRVIAGNLSEHQAPAPAPNSWAFDPSHEVAIWIITMDPQAVLDLPVASETCNRTVFFCEGNSFEINDFTISEYKAVELNASIMATLKNGDSTSTFLLLQGKPIGEPVVQYGPFVMNTQSEIRNAMNEYQLTQFGGWPWKSYENVHPREKSRFALYPDGKLEERPL
ncbi:MAG: pirin family protein [Cytophagales bacterium]|nr:pirin family protein [Cytophagales bacterium]